MNHLRWTALAALPLALGTLSGCGSDDAGDTGSTASASPTPEDGAMPGGGEQFAEIQKCLEAAGLADAMPSGGPGEGGTPPSGAPTGEPPSDLPSDMPSGMPSDMPSDMPGGGGIGGAFQDPDVQKALEACGISLPTE